jgi:hypothetical protein
LIGWPVSRPRSNASRKPWKWKRDVGQYQTRWDATDPITATTHLLNSRDVLIWDVSTDDPVLKRHVLAGVRIHGHRLDPSLDLSKLTGTSTLLLVHIVKLARLGDGLAEGHTRFTGDTRHVVLSLHPLDVDVQV